MPPDTNWEANNISYGSVSLQATTTAKLFYSFSRTSFQFFFKRFWASLYTPCAIHIGISCKYMWTKSLYAWSIDLGNMSLYVVHKIRAQAHHFWRHSCGECVLYACACETLRPQTLSILSRTDFEYLHASVPDNVQPAAVQNFGWYDVWAHSSVKTQNMWRIPYRRSWIEIEHSRTSLFNK